MKIVCRKADLAHAACFVNPKEVYLVKKARFRVLFGAGSRT